MRVPSIQSLTRQPPWVILVFASTLLLVVAYLEWITGPNIRLGVFYLIPLALVTFRVNARAGYAMALVTAVTWLFTDVEGGKISDKPFIASANGSVRLLFLVFTVYLLSVWKAFGQRLERMIEERTAALTAEIAERKAAEEALHQLALELAEAEDAQRRRLANDIHDALGQNLTVLKIRLESAAAGGDGASALRTLIGDSVGIIKSLITQTRTLTFELYPPMLEDLGLVPTLRGFAKSFGRQTQTQVSVEEQGISVKLPLSVSSHLFRSIKELINNARKHGQATEIVVAIYWQDEDVRVVVDDNGCGLDTAALSSSGAAGLGLAAIRERTTTLGGSLELESELSKGCRAILLVPLALSRRRAS